MGISYSQMMIVLVVAVVLFGSRLPDVLRQVGRAYAQLRKGLSEFQYTLEDPDPPSYGTRSAARIGSSNSSQARTGRIDTTDPGEEDFSRGSAPKFSPPPTNELN
jgi:sec-independent protein translocase protein TatA